jgi:NitT/TauT family transport system permease protein
MSIAVAAPGRVRSSGASPGVKGAVLVLLVGGVLAAWFLASYWTPSYALPGPLSVLNAAADFFVSARKFGHLVASIENVFLSIALSFVLGSLLAFLAHYAEWSAPTIYSRLGPFLGAFPSIGWTLLAVIWFGVSRSTVVFTVSAVLLPFAMINLREGLRALDREMDEMGRSFTRHRWRIFLAIVVPSLLPFAAATLRIMFGVAWKVVLTAELFGGNRGLGYLVNNARQDFDTATIFAVIGFIILAVYGSDRLVFAPFERLMARRFGGRR